MSAPDDWQGRRLARRKELAKLSKTRLVAMCRTGVRRPDGGRTVVEGGQAPVSRWTREEIENSIVSVEIPAPPES